MYGAGDVRVEQRPDATVRQPTDAVVRMVRMVDPQARTMTVD